MGRTPVVDPCDGNDPETYAIICAAMEVHRQIGHGFLEAVYQESLAIEFDDRQVPFRREVDIPIRYKGRTLACSYRADFICFGAVVIELKAVSELTVRDHAQVLNYLKVTGISRGLLFNFASSRLEYKRFILSSSYLRPSATSAVETLPS